MIHLSEFEGRLTDEEMADGFDFITRLNAARGTNTRRLVHSGDTKESRARAKMAEIFISKLLDTPLDLNIHAYNDHGIDTIYKGRWVQVKRGGTRTRTRGKGWFRLELNDPSVVDPPWDLGFLVEDDIDDDHVFRLTGWITRDHWLRGKREIDWPPQRCWAVTNPAAPTLLQQLNVKTPSRAWPACRCHQ